MSRLVRAGSVVRVPYSDMDLQSSGIDCVGGIARLCRGFSLLWTLGVVDGTVVVSVLS